MDGLTALQRIMVECPTPVVMLSALTQRGARTTIQALMRGAVDFVPKPAADIDIKSVIEELTAKVKVAAGAPLPSASVTGLASEAAATTQVKPRPFRPRRSRDCHWVFHRRATRTAASVVRFAGSPGSCSGGRTAHAGWLYSAVSSTAQRELFARSGGGHLRQTFGARTSVGGARRLSSTIRGGGRLVLDQGPRRNHLRPAVDIAMETAAEYHKSATIGVVLTGMGSDGTEGARHIKAAGGRVIAEHESTSVVYGMPRSVVEAGLADHVVPLPQIASTLVEWTK